MPNMTKTTKKDTKKTFLQGNNIIAQLLRMILFGPDAGRSDYSR